LQTVFVSLFFVSRLLTASAGQDFTASVVGVSDGDTITVYDGMQQTEIRLEGIDCPEESADFSQRAKQHTSDLVFGRQVRIVGKELDKYGRLVARVHVENVDVSLSLVESGLAWHYKHYSNDPVLAAAETLARAKKVGVWSLPNPTPPWETRNPTLREASAGAPRGLLSSSSTSIVYHGNSKSRVYHGPGCQHYDCSNCKVQLTSKEEAARLGFRPHVQCAGSAASSPAAVVPRPTAAASSSPANRVTASETIYHGNASSKVYHGPGCQHYNCKNCTVTLKSKEEAAQRGFRPHSGRGGCVK
jgi:endonuclease YncB( thermonuclease family)